MTNWDLLKIIKINEKQIKARELELVMVDKYLEKKDFSKTLDFDKVGGEEYTKLTNEVGAFNAINTIKKGMNQTKHENDELRKAMRNPK